MSRFPDQNIMRWATVRNDAGIGWPIGRVFIRLFDKWMSPEFPRDAALEQQLLETYRAVWEGGGDLDRAFVLNFINCGHEAKAPDLIVEGLASANPGLAHTALFAAGSAIRAGVDLGPETKSLIQAYVTRFPDNWVSAQGVWLDLGEREGWITPPEDDGL